MEKIVTYLPQKLETVKQPEQQNCLENLKKALAPVDLEDKMIQLKYSGPQIGMMRIEDVKHWSMALVLKIHVITGWVIPDSQLMNILVDQFEKKLLEDYGNLNPEEIEYAFRKYGTIIKDWGKAMNLNLIDQVLIEYLDKRLLASAIEEKKKSILPDQKIYTDQENLNQRRYQIETTFQAMKKGYNPILHPYFLEVLQFDKLLIEGETLEAFFVRRLFNNSAQIYQAA